MIKRTAIIPLSETITDFNKMAFLSGPRQVGKTTLAQEFQKKAAGSFYFNWDLMTHQKMLLKDPYFFEKQNRDPRKPFLVVFDEIHKYARWKNYLKGAYDGFKDEFQFLVTGSGRLDLFKKGGDSLLGRYFSHPLLPLTVGEISGTLPPLKVFKDSLAGHIPAASKKQRDAYETLFQLSGFPEPFLRGTTRFYNTWFSDRKSLLLREDIRDASRVREISLLEMLSHLIPDRVGAPLSINSLREDIGVAFETVRDWLLLLEQFYYLFRLKPYSKKLSRSIKKEAKAYLYDWAEISDEGRRFENMVGLHLFKAFQTWRSMGERDIGLQYLRDKDGREVDFVGLQNGKPFFLAECKLTDENPAPSLLAFQRKLAVPVAVQLLHKPGICKKTKENGFTQWVISADRWLAAMP